MSEVSGSQPRLARITLFPIKSLEGISVDSAQILVSGALEHDRQFAIRDEQGRFVNGKRTDCIHRLRSACDPIARRLIFRNDEISDPVSFHIDDERADLEAWLSDNLAMSVTLVEDAIGGFPDDTDAAGPTVISTATLGAITEWFPEIDLDEARRRFRANLEIEGTEPFWEDRLFAEEGAVVAFQIGGVTLAGVNPCARCVVPSRNTADGERIDWFRERFMEHRRRTLPDWSESSRFNHFYGLAVNTRPLRNDVVNRPDISASDISASDISVSDISVSDIDAAASVQVGQSVQILGRQPV